MERGHLETAAAKYTGLRGLLALPGGALCILAALGNWEVGPFRHAWAFLAAVALLGVVWLALSRHYTDNYGRMSPSAGQQFRLGVALAGYARWRSNERAIAADEPLPESRLAPAVFASVGTVPFVV